MRCLAFICACLAIAACDGKRALTEWQPSDHQPPPAVAPEGQGTGSDNPAESNARAAQTLWDSRCATCHGAGGHGDGPGKPPGAVIPDFTTREYAQRHTNEELHQIIAQGRGLMPPFGAELTDLGIDAMIAHIRTLAH